MTDDAPDRPPATMLSALAVRRNVTVGLAVGVGVALAAYAIRVFELLGPVASARQYPIVGPETWFLLLSVVFAVSAALGVTLLLTAVHAYRLTRRVSEDE